MNWTILIFGILLLLVTSCKPDKPFEKIEFPSVNFIIDSNTDTTLFGEQGTRIFIGSEIFQFPNGELVEDSIKIQVKEFYKKSDIILADLSTVSDGKLLETGGMILIEATSNDEKIEIKADKRIVVHFPKEKFSYKKMNLFFPDATATDTSVNNWNIDTVSLVKKTLKLGSFGYRSPSWDDSTEYNFTPKNFVDTGYYWNPIDFYVSSYNFSEETIREIEQTRNTYPRFNSWNDYGVGCEMNISTKGYIKYPKINTNVSLSTKRELIRFLKELPQLKAGRNKYDEIIERKGFLFIQGGNIIPLYETDKEYVESFDSKYSQFEDQPIKNMDVAEANYYIFSVSQLGWINCDRFINAEERIDLLANIPVSPDTKLKMAFSEFNGFLKPNIVEGKYVFSKIPKGQEATIVGIKNENGRLLAAFEKIIIGDEVIPDIKFSEVTLSDLKKKLEEI